MSTELENVKKQEEEYSASNIQVLEGLEAVRKRPAMYIGDIGEKGLHHLVYEVVDNSIDEALAGYCTDIDVTINEDNSITVRDNGRGIPTDYHEKEGKSALEVVLTVLHAGGKFDKGSYKVSGGLHGVGVSCVNALSTLLIAEIRSRDGKIYRQTYSKGAPTSQVEVIGECSDRGTTITFKPDEQHLHAHDGIQIRHPGQPPARAGVPEQGHPPEPLRQAQKDDERQYAATTTSTRKRASRSSSSTSTPRAARRSSTRSSTSTPRRTASRSRWPCSTTTRFSENVHSYVNNINTIEGGTHLTGFRRALTRTLKKYAEDSGMLSKAEVRHQRRRLPRRTHGRGFGEGAGTAVRGPDQDQTGQRRGVRPPSIRRSSAALGHYLEENPKDAKAQSCSKVILAATARHAARHAREMVQRKTVAFGCRVYRANWPTVRARDRSIKAEIFFVEGDSAGGTAKSGRDRNIPGHHAAAR